MILTPTLPALIAQPVAARSAQSVPGADALRVTAVQPCPAATPEDDCPYCSGPETD